MSGLAIEDGQIVITNGSRTVATTGGTLLQFLTDEQTFAANIDFPDPDKAQLYQFEYQIQRAPGDNYFAIRKARSSVGALLQEWSNTVVLGEAPEGADLFVGRASMVRTISPSHTWLNQNIAQVIPSGQYFQLTGSVLVEAAIGITRSMTVDVQGGNLVARLQHSVGPAAGNFRQIGTMPPASPDSAISPNNITSGAENIVVGGGDVFPVWWTDTAPYYLNEGEANPSVGPTGGSRLWCQYAAYGWPHAVSYTDPTDYSTRYAITVKGRFGRRS